ncbi:MAG: hypothetical protein IT426_05300 [Pirellulales bacterium]|nr:hypothetical protein [Pirellulales bacterium]
MSCKPTRREFIQLTGAASVLLAAGSNMEAMAGPFEPKDIADHFVPVDKKLKPEWIKKMFEKGERTWYSGSDLSTIGMPICGITTGQLYLTGDGRLAHWDIFNMTRGANRAYEAGRRMTFPVKQGFAVQVEAGGKAAIRTLDAEGFPGVRFCGEYPLGFVEYKDESLPVSIALEAFSPFIPLNAADSALPMTVLQFTVKNTSSAPLEVGLAGWLQNAVSSINGDVMLGKRVNRAVRKDGLSLIESIAVASAPPKSTREPIVLADFEGDDYGKWTVQGNAFGDKPARGTLPGQQPVTGFQGRGLANSYLDGDGSRGKLTSPKFKIERPFINFLIGGGNRKGTRINLLVGGNVVRTKTGRDDERLLWTSWNVRDYEGQEAQIEILDRQAGSWGHINVDQIEMADVPRSSASGAPEKLPDFGSMALAMLGRGEEIILRPSLPEEKIAESLLDAPPARIPAEAESSIEKLLIGGLGKRIKLAAGQEEKVTFFVTWHFPNREQHGNFYTNRFSSAAAVAEYAAKNLDRLQGETHLWHKTWYDSTLPYWLLDRLFSTTSILATGTCQWWANGRFWAWEGVACCAGTCGHVWNYEHAMARLFPELERSVREMQDYDPKAGFVEATGEIHFRGESARLWAGDSQPGYVLKAYREHQMSSDSEFLKKLWQRIRKSMEFMILQDGDGDGLVEGQQHNTYDINFFGPNTMVGSLYLAALRAAAAMAREVGDLPFAEQCEKIYQSGREKTVAELFNGEYFIQKVDLGKYPMHQYGEGCLADQLFGEGWARQVGFEHIYPADKVRSALKAIWIYNWAPDVAPQNKAHPPQRWFARPGEAGLFTCTWPKSKHLGPKSVLYRDEVWTGIEYQVAGNMAWEGMLTEALAICRAVHERYHPSKYNPWNEIECGDHYSRAMASYGVFLALSGYEYFGPKRQLGFAPKITPEDFRGAFTTAEGWGTFAQKRAGGVQTERIEVRWGKLPLKTLRFELPEGLELQKATVAAAGKPLTAQARAEGRSVQITLADPVVLSKGEVLTVELR